MNVAPGPAESRAQRLWPVAFAVEARGRPLTAYQWGPPASWGTLVICAHGFGDHGRAQPYALLAEALACAGHTLVTFDQRGHGSDCVTRPRVSQGLSGSVLHTDLRAVVTSCLERFGRSSAVLAGLSMGALVALETALADPTGLQGLVIAAAPLGPVRASKFALLLTRLLSRLAPTLPIAPRLDLASISKDAALVKEYVSDPLFHQRLTIGFAKELLSASARLRTAVADLRIPTLHLHGEADRIAPWDEASVRAFPQHLYSRRLYGAAGHNLFLETERSDVFSDIVQWLSSLRR